MGYRSDVAIAVYGDSENMAEFKHMFEEQVKQLPEDEQEWLQGLIEHSKVITDRELFTDDSMLFQAEDVKWYEGYNIPDMFEKVYNYAPRLGLSGELLRIGEELNDVQYDNVGENCEYYLSVSRTIEATL